MFRSIWQIVSAAYSQRRSGIDKADIEHLRADLRFRLSLVEYAYFGKSGKRVSRCTAELKALLGEKAMHRYLRSLDPDLRTQFVERFQGARRDAEAGIETGPRPAEPRREARFPKAESPAVTLMRLEAATMPGSNVVPIDYAARKATGEPAGGGQSAKVESQPRQGTGSADSSE